MATREDRIAKADGRPRSWAARLFPVLAGLPDYRRGWFRHDAVAALTVWALVVPEAMAYAVIAGVPVQYGLYAVPLALLGYVVFGGSRKLFVGPSASVATISAVTVGSVVAASAAPSEFIALTAALALTVGVIYVALGVARMGFLARFFAKPVLDGFIIGLGLYIAIGQLPKLVGIEKPSGNTVRVLG
jgi:sulfate permease, SulP family